ncbi:ferritin-1 heavy chain-like [Teleopsis dalmanni]|uniref:ferritin-1 heavy chain-like n=1 Tax=Teleopsis dalmanni TaxID=139649 RepID=UPI0018CD407D|nr:ferritin-1 heavy chain-like [Teleopsis dalmanni]XP_037949522.1 ferritin-1 heavy chain-like [Teleopsis dalmanni]
MKLFAFILVSCLCAAVYAATEKKETATEKKETWTTSNNCNMLLERVCLQPSPLKIDGKIAELCNAKYNIFDNKHVSDYVGELLFKSYEYLYLATRFGAYQKNRSGFQKLYKELSDKHFDEAIDLIKHINKRGVSINMLEIISNSKEYKKDVKFYSLDKDELHSLGIALDIEKELFEKAANVTNHAIHDIDNTEKNGRHTKHYKHRDPEFAHYFEEKFLGSQAETVRKLSGYFNDLLKIVRDEQQELGFYMFDEYLQKQ